MLTEKDFTDKLYFGIVIPRTTDKDCDQGDLEYYRVYVHEVAPEAFLVQAIGHQEKCTWAIRLDQGEVRVARCVECYDDDNVEEHDVADDDAGTVQLMSLSQEQQEELARNTHDPIGLVLALARIEKMEVHLENDLSPCFQV